VGRSPPPAGIRPAWAGQRVPVLPISAHGGPGVLGLEDDTGAVREVSAEEFVTEAIPPGQMPAVVSLAACHTDAAPAGGRSFAADLLAHGAAAVIGTETAVTDRYATRGFARVYTELAHAAAPDLLA